MRAIIILMAIAGVLDAMYGSILVNVEYSAIGALGMMAIGAGAGMAEKGLEFGLNRGASESAMRQQYANQTLLNEQAYRNSLGLMKEQNKYNREFYDYTYDKESYQAQVRQLQDAGLNIGLMYKGASGVGGQTASVGASASGGGAGLSAPNVNMNSIGMGMQLGLQEAQIKLMNAQANKLNVEATKVGGVDTQESLERIANIAQSTSNERLKGIILGYDAQMKEISTNVANMTSDALIRATLANYEKMMQEATQETLKTQVDSAVVYERIEQVKQATQMNYIEMEAKRLNIQLTNEQILKVKQEVENLVNNIDTSQRETAVKEVLAKWQTSDAQLYKLYSEIFKNGAQGIENIGKLFKKTPEVKLPPTKYERTLQKGGHWTEKTTQYEY